MTLFKQVALTVSMIIILMLSFVMYINYQSSKQYLIESLYETTVNNISSLSNKLAQNGEDEADIATIIDSEFDSGYYHSIRYSSNQSDFVYLQEDNEKLVDVPMWFIKFADISVETVTVDVSSGWNIMGELSVVGDTNVIYKTLYKMFTRVLYLFGITLSIALLILGVLLHFVLKPLKAVQGQAEAILHNKFVIQENEPYTQEFKEVVKGMNAMVKKVETLFHTANESAKRNKELLYNDPVTKLYNRRYYMLKISDLIGLENRINGGVSIFISLSSVEVVTQSIGQRNTQSLLISFANLLSEAAKNFDDEVVARMNEREFAMIFSACDVEDVTVILEKINREFLKLLEKNEIDEKILSISFGVYRYTAQVKLDELLTRTDNALLNAVAKEGTNIALYEDKDSKNALAKDAWHKIIKKAIDDESFKLKFWPTLNATTKTLDHKVMTFTIKNQNAKEYYFGDFIAPAINFGLVGELFTSVIKDILTHNYDELNDGMCSIRLSNEFIKDVHSLDSLSKLFSRYAKKQNYKLFFEIADSFAIKNEQLVKSFVDLFEKYGFGFAINSFTGESSDFRYLKELNPMYIKVDSRFLLDQSEESMSSLQVIVDSLGIEIVATFVNSLNEVASLGDKNVTLIQGPATDLL